MRPSENQSLASNRKAFHDYHILETVEAGIALTGTEIKSIREGKASLQEGFARIFGRDAWLENVYVAPYEHGGRENPEPKRRRRLLLHRRELDRLAGQIAQKGLTLVPLRMYLKGRRAKVELGLAKGKKLYDKREAIAERDAKRSIERVMRGRD
jgi:SsrA-binding protein